MFYNNTTNEIKITSLAHTYNTVLHTLYNTIESPLYELVKCQKGLSQLQIKL